MTYKLRFFADFCLALTASQTLIRGFLEIIVMSYKQEDGVGSVDMVNELHILAGERLHEVTSQTDISSTIVAGESINLKTDQHRVVTWC